MEKEDWRWRDGLSRKARSPMNIWWEFTLNCFWFVYFSIQCFSTHSTRPESDTPTPPHPSPPPILHKWCSDVHQRGRWRITKSYCAMQTKEAFFHVTDHWKPPLMLTTRWAQTPKTTSTLSRDSLTCVDWIAFKLSLSDGNPCVAFCRDEYLWPHRLSDAVLLSAIKRKH